MKMKIAVILINGFPHTRDEGIPIAYPLRIAYLPTYDIIDVRSIQYKYGIKHSPTGL